MAEQNDTGIKTFIAAIALKRGRGVSLASTAGEIEYPADESEEIIGVTLADAAAAEEIEVALLTKPGTFKVELGDRITTPMSDSGIGLHVLSNGQFVDADYMDVSSSSTTSGSRTTRRFYAIERGSGRGSFVEAIVAGLGE